MMTEYQNTSVREQKSFRKSPTTVRSTVLFAMLGFVYGCVAAILSLFSCLPGEKFLWMRLISSPFIALPGPILAGPLWAFVGAGLAQRHSNSPRLAVIVLLLLHYLVLAWLLACTPNTDPEYTFGCSRFAQGELWTILAFVFYVGGQLVIWCVLAYSIWTDGLTYTIRDLLLLTAIVAFVLGWCSMVMPL